MKRYLLWIAGLILCAPAPASAYVDPTAGALIVQLLLGGLAGLGVLAKLYWKKLTGWFKRGPEE